MKKGWNLTEKILTREKTIESRWYKNKYPPWNKIKPGEAIYFKNSGEPVTIKTKVGKVLQFSDLNKNKRFYCWLKPGYALLSHSEIYSFNIPPISISKCLGRCSLPTIQCFIVV